VSGSLLDTSVLIADRSTVGPLPRLAAISVVSVGELHAGVLLARDDAIRTARRERLEAIRRAFAPLVVDEAVALWYGEVLARARRAGRTEKATDLLIVATAAAHGRELVTLDDRQAALAEAAGVAVAAR
jgi:predicted nucleic acid-binding protein